MLCCASFKCFKAPTWRSDTSLWGFPSYMHPIFLRLFSGRMLMSEFILPTVYGKNKNEELVASQSLIQIPVVFSDNIRGHHHLVSHMAPSYLSQQ